MRGVRRRIRSSARGSRVGRSQRGGVVLLVVAAHVEVVHVGDRVVVVVGGGIVRLLFAIVGADFEVGDVVCDVVHVRGVFVLGASLASVPVASRGDPPFILAAEMRLFPRVLLHGARAFEARYVARDEELLVVWEVGFRTLRISTLPRPGWTLRDEVVPGDYELLGGDHALLEERARGARGHQGLRHALCTRWERAVRG